MPEPSGRHEALLAVSPGYVAFTAREREIDPDLSLVEAFADWLVAPGEPVEAYADWSADDFRSEWEAWNS